MRVARVVACASSSSVATRICIDASVCCRRARESTDGAAELWIEYGTFRACAGTPAAPVAVVQVGGVASDLPAPCTTGASCCSTATGFGKLEQDAQRHHFTLGLRQLAQRSLERFRQSFAELLD